MASKVTAQKGQKPKSFCDPSSPCKLFKENVDVQVTVLTVEACTCSNEFNMNLGIFATSKRVLLPNLGSNTSDGSP